MTVKELRAALKGKVQGIWKLNKAQLEIAYFELNNSDESVVEKALEGKTLLEAKTEEQWLEIREGGIGGSDIAAIVGYNKYSSKIDVFISKASRNNAVLRQEYQEKQQKIKEKFSVKMGHILEPVVANMFQENHKEYKVVNFPVTVKANPWEVANVDRYLIDKKGKVGVLEIKTTSANNKKDWEGGTVPDNYFIQVQWYLGITGLDYAHIACLVGGQEYFEFRIEKDEEAIKYLRSEARIFWEDHVVLNEVPEVDGTSSYTDHLKFIAERVEDRGEKIDIEGIDLDEEYDSIKEKIKELENKKRKIENLIFAQAIERGSKRGTWGDHHTFSIIGGTSNRFDTSKFKKEHPEMYDLYVKVTEKKPYIRIN